MGIFYIQLFQAAFSTFSFSKQMLKTTPFIMLQRITHLQYQYDLINLVSVHLKGNQEIISVSLEKNTQGNNKEIKFTTSDKKCKHNK